MLDNFRDNQLGANRQTLVNETVKPKCSYFLITGSNLQTINHLDCLDSANR
jgi:hypothetical protein